MRRPSDRLLFALQQMPGVLVRLFSRRRRSRWQALLVDQVIFDQLLFVEHVIIDEIFNSFSFLNNVRFRFKYGILNRI
jgi:hypothetical protein